MLFVDVNCTAKDVTNSSSVCNTTSNVIYGEDLLPKIDSDGNFGMYLRAFYVIIGLTAIVVIYLGVKTFM